MEYFMFGLACVFDIAQRFFIYIFDTFVIYDGITLGYLLVCSFILSIILRYLIAIPNTAGGGKRGSKRTKKGKSNSSSSSSDS